jgi:hypothetical protein
MGGPAHMRARRRALFLVPLAGLSRLRDLCETHFVPAPDRSAPPVPSPPLRGGRESAPSAGRFPPPASQGLRFVAHARKQPPVSNQITARARSRGEWWGGYGLSGGHILEGCTLKVLPTRTLPTAPPGHPFLERLARYCETRGRGGREAPGAGHLPPPTSCRLRLFVTVASKASGGEGTGGGRQSTISPLAQS